MDASPDSDNVDWSERDSLQTKLTPLCFLNTFLLGGGLVGEITVTCRVLWVEPIALTGNIRFSLSSGNDYGIQYNIPIYNK